MTFLTCEVVHEDAAGTVRRSTFDWAVYYSASHRCVEWDGREYGVAVVPPGVDVNCFPGYATEEEARAAIHAFPPRWPNHARDHARALKG